MSSFPLCSAGPIGLSPLPFLLVPASRHEILAVEESIVALVGHGRERLIPPGARIACGLDYEAIVLHFALHFISKPCLFEEWLLPARLRRLPARDGALTASERSCPSWDHGSGDRPVGRPLREDALRLWQARRSSPPWRRPTGFPAGVSTLGAVRNRLSITRGPGASGGSSPTGRRSPV
jgi:hypothetical protein